MKTEKIYVRVSLQEKACMIELARELGYTSVSELIRYLVFEKRLKTQRNNV